MPRTRTSLAALTLFFGLIGCANESEETARGRSGDFVRTGPGAFSAAEVVYFEAFDEMAVSADAIVTGTVSASLATERDTGPSSDDLDLTSVSIDIDEQLGGHSNAPAIVTLETLSAQYSDDERLSHDREWRSPGTRVVAFLIDIPKEGWAILNSQGLYLIDDKDRLNAVTRDDESGLVKEVSAWTLTELSDRVAAAFEREARGKVKPVKDPRKA